MSRPGLLQLLSSEVECTRRLAVFSMNSKTSALRYKARRPSLQNAGPLPASASRSNQDTDLPRAAATIERVNRASGGDFQKSGIEGEESGFNERTSVIWDALTINSTYLQLTAARSEDNFLSY